MIGSSHALDRPYPAPVRSLLQAVMAVAFVVYGVVLALLFVRPELGLRVLWYAVIPLAPMILLVAPNAWVSICPISTAQTLAQRAGRRPDRRLSARATERLQVLGWILMLAGIPTRHLVFNTVGWATLATALAITGIALVVGLSFRSLSGWCVGLCPIRPVEALYGQFALDRHRPEKCTECTACIASCLRLVPERSHAELHRSRVIAQAAMGFPGFVAAYFLLDLLGLCPVEHEFLAGVRSTVTDWSRQATLVYGVMFGGFALSWITFATLRAAILDEATMFRAVALAAFGAYYLGVAPEICEAWGWSMWAVPALLVLPAAAMTCVLWPRDAAPRRAAGPAV
jgi:ferredoxin